MNTKEQRGRKKKKILRIAIKAPNRVELTKWVKDIRLDIGGTGGVRLQPDDTLRMEAFAPEEILDELKKSGATFEVIEDATKVGAERQKEVGRGDRFEGGKIAPRGLGKKE